MLIYICVNRITVYNCTCFSMYMYMYVQYCGQEDKDQHLNHFFPQKEVFCVILCSNRQTVENVKAQRTYTCTVCTCRTNEEDKALPSRVQVKQEHVCR